MFDFKLHKIGFTNIFDQYSKKNFLEKSKNINIVDYEKFSERINFEFDMLDMVCTWYPRKADCIHKTFLGYKILRKKYHIQVDMVVGIRKFPFEAHAWLIEEDRNFFGDEEETNKYKIILNSNDFMGG